MTPCMQLKFQIENNWFYKFYFAFSVSWRTTALIAKTDFSDRLKAEIDGMVAEIFDDAEGSKMYAVRSSAVGKN